MSCTCIYFHRTWSGEIAASSSSQSTSIPSSNKVCTTGASPCSQALNNCRTRSMWVLVPKISVRFTHDCRELPHSETYFKLSSHCYIRLFFPFIVIYLSLCSPFWFRSWRHFVPKCFSVNTYHVWTVNKQYTCFATKLYSIYLCFCWISWLTLNIAAGCKIYF